MAYKTGVALVTQEPWTESAVISALKASDRLEAVGTYQGLPDLVARLELQQVPLALVDIDPHSGDVLRNLDSVTSRFSDTRFVVLSAELRNDLVLEAMQAGARHILMKRSIGEDLVAVLHRLVPRNGRAAELKGALISVLSVSGGCGATTVAVNLASEIQLKTSEPSLIVDLDSAYGTVATYLGVKGQYGIADVLASPGRIDAELIRSSAVAHSENLRVLLSPVSVSFANPLPLDFAVLGEALKACKAAFGFTVVDAPRVSLETAATLARSSKLTLLVFQLTVRDLRMAKATWAGLAERGVPSIRVMAVANRFRKWRQVLTLDEARQALPGVPIETLRNDFRSSIRALNFGQPLYRIASRSVLRRSLEALASKLVALPVTPS